ncbi:hypothetical protein GE09DRAFT_416225 [Coniochaeta sp. 2T2.1]|nr:hypothetical protein GE09DRAFT_416225 [Coniochaeta sp. 2T2.1]
MRCCHMACRRPSLSLFPPAITFQTHARCTLNTMQCHPAVDGLPIHRCAVTYLFCCRDARRNTEHGLDDNDLTFHRLHRCHQTPRLRGFVAPPDGSICNHISHLFFQLHPACWQQSRPVVSRKTINDDLLTSPAALRSALPVKRALALQKRESRK